jgi:hypothetical protein
MGDILIIIPDVSQTLQHPGAWTTHKSFLQQTLENDRPQRRKDVYRIRESADQCDHTRSFVTSGAAAVDAWSGTAALTRAE